MLAVYFGSDTRQLLILLGKASLKHSQNLFFVQIMLQHNWIYITQFFCLVYTFSVCLQFVFCEESTHFETQTFISDIFVRAYAKMLPASLDEIEVWNPQFMILLKKGSYQKCHPNWTCMCRCLQSRYSVWRSILCWRGCVCPSIKVAVLGWYIFDFV